ncbi:hypothetical protein B0H10DRAFT_2161434 [Mycena sp. CBHHK59/15]|nr:hypothetical protein B0H10DRAFT_2161434 [Mycena sp. CBHHK59/15]
MARATRSSQQEKALLKPLDSKKRKRTFDVHDEPAFKQQRTDADAGSQPIDAEHAHKILHVLQMIDHQGLLDRVYALASQDPPTPNQPTFSLRTLLADAEDYPLATLRTAVHNLLPISVHPRAPPPAPAAQQHRFCTIALDLLDQASFHPVSLDLPSVLAPDPPDDDAPAPAATPPPRPVGLANKRYALMQHLPTGDYWTSANAPPTAPPDTGPADLKDLPTGHAELVAIFPTPSAPATATVPTLGEYIRPPASLYESRQPKLAPAKRVVTCGNFLDYGPWSSFAPAWDQNGREVGMRQMGEVYAQRAQRYREKLQARQRAVELEHAQAVVQETKEQPAAEVPLGDSDVEALQDILTPAEIESLKSVLGSLELENAVQELLNRNRTALHRLGQLQVARLRSPGGRTSSVQEGDEEWDVAHGILDSLALLASLRPRSSAHPAAPLVPPPPVLHRLRQTLPPSPTPGWTGTLPVPPRATALRDDATVRVRPGASAAPLPVTAPVAPATPTPAAGYYQPQQYRPAPAGTQYRYNNRTPAQAQAQGQATPQYYAANQLPYGAYTAQGGWYGAYGGAPATPGQATYGGGTATPTYGAATPVTYGAATPTYRSATPTYGTGAGTPAAQGTYGAFFGAAGGERRTPAVANTVAGASGMKGWQTPPVLPAHLRTAAAGQGAYYGQQGYGQAGG